LRPRWPGAVGGALYTGGGVVTPR